MAAETYCIYMDIFLKGIISGYRARKHKCGC